MTRTSRILGAAALLALVAALAGCGGSRVAFRYPSESLVFPQIGEQTPRLFVEFVNDLRPDSQRGGVGGPSTFRFPSDESWDTPVNQIYYQALVQDLTQTDLVEVVPLRSQADYFLEVDLRAMGCKVRRSGAGFGMAAAVGGGIGFVLGRNAGSAIAGAVLGIGAVPVPTRVRAVCEVMLRVRDADQELFWEQACLGEITKDTWEGMTSRKDQEWVDRYLTVAVKRCNGCLVGQLRQALVEADAE